MRIFIINVPSLLKVVWVALLSDDAGAVFSNTDMYSTRTLSEPRDWESHLQRTFLHSVVTVGWTPRITYP